MPRLSGALSLHRNRQPAICGAHVRLIRAHTVLWVVAALLTAQFLTLSASTPYIQTAALPLAPLTDAITIRLQRPTTTQPRRWALEGRCQVSAVVTVDGQEHRCTVTRTGGLRRVGRRDRDASVLRLQLPWGFFGRRGGRPTRVGEGAAEFTCRVELLRLAGELETWLDVEATEAPAPAVAFHSSVAFESALDAQDVSGDGSITLNVTPSGSDTAIFVGAGNSSGSGGSLGSTTYAGAAMTEAWDAIFASNLAHAGYYKCPITGGAQNVINTCTGPDEHAVGAILLSGVHQSTPVGTPVASSGSSATPSNTVTGMVTGDLVLDSMYANGSSGTAGANQTERCTEGVGGFTIFKMSTQAGVDGGVMSWTITSAAWGHGAVAFLQAGGALALDQEGYRWRNDDGSETTATWKAAQDTAASIAPDETTRLRMLVNATNDPASAQYKLQYRKVGDASWRDVDTDG